MNARDPHTFGTCFADLQRWIKSRISSAHRKRNAHLSKPPLLPTAVSDPWEVIAADCIDPLPVTN